MNQILMDDNSNSNYYSSKNYQKSNEPMDIQTILKIYAVITIIFGALLIGKGAYAMVEISNSNVATTANNNTAQISMIQVPQEEGDKVKISILSSNSIDKIVYRWNDGLERTIKGNNQTSIEQLIDCPTGKNTLYVQIIDKEGTKQEKNQEFVTENGVDINNPTIKLDLTPDRRLKITATDDINLDYITYRWNQEEEKKISTEDETQVKIETTIDILKEENVLTVVAVDGKGNSTTETKKFKGVLEPEIAVNLSDDGTKLLIKVTHVNGIKRIYYTLNDKPYEATFNDGEQPKTFEFEQKLDVGYNRIIMEVTSIDDTVKKFDGQCDYNP